jgi:copper(I)-binding protein
VRRLSLYLFLSWLTAAPAWGATASISVEGARSRPAIETAVVYATLRNRGATADRLIGATSPVASLVGLHQSYATETKGPSPGGGMPMGTMPMGMPANRSMIGMRSVSSIEVPARGSVTLRPGGYHLMLDLRHAVRAGDTIPVRWHFARAGWISTKLTVAAFP